jgi:hypothetical protein
VISEVLRHGDLTGVWTSCHQSVRPRSRLLRLLALKAQELGHVDKPSTDRSRISSPNRGQREDDR